MKLPGQSPVICQWLLGMVLMHRRVDARTALPCSKRSNVLAVLLSSSCSLTPRAQRSWRLIKLAELPQVLQLPAVKCQFLVRTGWVGSGLPIYYKLLQSSVNDTGLSGDLVQGTFRCATPQSCELIAACNWHDERVSRWSLMSRILLNTCSMRFGGLWTCNRSHASFPARGICSRNEAETSIFQYDLSQRSISSCRASNAGHHASP